jgi:hypothetical protein
VYGASSGWSDELFVADFDVALYHGVFSPTSQHG